MGDEQRNKMNKKGASKKVTIEFEPLTVWRFATVILAILLIISITTGGFRGSDGSGTTGTPTAAPSPTPTQPTAPGKATVSVDDDPTMGKANAPVTFIEFSDYQCPFCGRFFSQTLGQLKAQYVETGKVLWAFRDYPLSFHPNADDAGVAANCAGEQDKYFEMHDKLFEGQANWQGLPDAASTFKGYAEGLGLDVAKYDKCYADDFDKHVAEQQKDLADGSAVGVQGTPGFVAFSKKASMKDIQEARATLPANVQPNVVPIEVNGKAGVRFSGALPFNVFQTMLDVMV